MLERGLVEGILRPGDRLPAQRILAARLGVDLSTVTRAYDEARRRDLLEGRGALGTFVVGPRVELEGVVDLSMNIPPAPADIDLAQLLRDGLSQILVRADADLLMTYQLGGGSVTDRRAAAKWLAPMLGAVDPECVLACPGAQSALAALILAQTPSGGTIFAEPLVYPGLRVAANQFGRRVEAVEADDEGMRPDALDKACRRVDARLLYLNPTIQNPTTVTMPAGRRREILRVAVRHKLCVVEDDPYWLLEDDAPPPLARLEPSRVHYVSTLSKCLSPGLRTAFVACPDARSAQAVLSALRAFSLMRTPITAALVTQWIEDGSAGRMMAGVRAEAHARQRLAAQSLGGVPAGPHASRQGIHHWHLLPSYWTAREFAFAARRDGLAVTPGAAFRSVVGDGAEGPNAIRISLGEGSDRRRLAQAFRRLSELLAQPPLGAAEAVV
jgi:DNA-binding transcriptional MocR family regulator